MMHPDHLPPRTVQSLLLRVLHFPLLRLVWTLLLLGLAGFLMVRLAPSVVRYPNESLKGAFRNALVLTFVLWASVHLLEGRTLGQALGLWLAQAPAQLGKGFLVGAGLLSLVVGALFLCGAYHVVGLGAGAGLRALGQALLLFFFIGVTEEVLFRGILFRLLEQGLGTWAALVSSSLLFGFIHLANPGATVVSALAIALEAGLLLGAGYVATRSLWFPIGLHTAWNFFEGPVYGTHVSGLTLPSALEARFTGPVWLSGGAFGPEAGLPAVILGGALGIYFLVVAGRRRQLYTPPWLRRLLGGGRPRKTPDAPGRALLPPAA